MLTAQSSSPVTFAGLPASDIRYVDIGEEGTKADVAEKREGREGNGMVDKTW